MIKSQTKKFMRKIFLKTKGFTLLELMIATVVLMIAIGGLLMAFTSCMLLSESNSNLTTAVNDAQYILEEIKGLDYANIDVYAASPPQFSNLDSEIITTAVTGTGTIKEITVNVAWVERQRNRNFQLSTRVAR